VNFIWKEVFSQGIFLIMKNSFLNILVLLVILSGCSDSINTTEGNEDDIGIPASGPIQLHPENSHYFLYNGKLLLLITSG
jgi:hypothetical protein